PPGGRRPRRGRPPARLNNRNEPRHRPPPPDPSTVSPAPRPPPITRLLILPEPWGVTPMKGILKGCPVLVALAALVSTGGRLSADDLYNKKPIQADTVAMPKPTEVVSLAVHPAQVTLKGTDDSPQPVLSGT